MANIYIWQINKNANIVGQDLVHAEKHDFLVLGLGIEEFSHIRHGPIIFQRNRTIDDAISKETTTTTIHTLALSHTTLNISSD